MIRLKYDEFIVNILDESSALDYLKHKIATTSGGLKCERELKKDVKTSDCQELIKQIAELRYRQFIL